MKKIVLIVGASSGIGKDLAKKLLLERHCVFCVARRVDNMQDLEKLGGHIFKMDVRDELNVEKVIANIINITGKIDVVYSNAGFPIAGPVEETPIDKVHEQFDTNVFGAARVARAVLPHMRKQNCGRIIFTTSIAGRISTGMNSWYSASKHALNGMVKGLSQEVAGFNIKVCTIEPGCVETELDALQLADMKATNKLDEYKEMVDKSHSFLYSAYRKGSDTKSTVDTMVKAGFCVSPKLSYRTTLDAKIMLFVQYLIGEKLMGNLFVNIIKRS